MKKLYRKIDAAGLFVEDVMANAPASNLIETPCPGGFYWPKWNGAQWVEGGAAPTPTPEQVRTSGIEAAIAGDAIVQAIKAMGNAEFDAWWSANVTTLTQANNVLKRVVRVLCRRVL